MENKLSPVSFKIKGDNLYIIYDEQVVESYKRFKGLRSNRILGIDLNPNYIGLSILEFQSDNSFQVIHKQIFDISNLNENGSKLTKSNLKYNKLIMKYLNYVSTIRYQSWLVKI